MNSNRFITMIFQMYVILKLYDLWHFITGLGFRTYLFVLIFLLYFVITLFFASHLGRNVPSLIPFKVFPKYAKTGQAFDFLFMATGMIVFGFVWGHYLGIYSLYVAIITSLFFTLLISKSNLSMFRYVVAAFTLGLIFNTSIANNLFVFGIAVFGNFYIYLISDINEF